MIDDAGGGLPVILDTALGSGILDRQRRDSSDQGKATESREPQSMAREFWSRSRTRMLNNSGEGVTRTLPGVSVQSVRDA